jgi:4-hydroxy-L-threonine phosphate dehydrogenase PdxA
MLSSLNPGKKLRIGVAALNPHAGEEGILGTEEKEIISPFCREHFESDVVVKGPIPADVLFRDAFKGDFDGVVAAYHDQAMIPLKLGGVGRMVNATMGLPFVRTSPDHGVAYDIAGKDRADPSGMGLAIDLAMDLLVSKR